MQQGLRNNFKLDWIRLAAVLWIIGSLLLSIFSLDRGKLIYTNFTIPMALMLMGVNAARHSKPLLAEIKIALAYLAWFALTRFLNGDHYLTLSLQRLYALSIAVWIALPLSSMISDKNRRTVETIIYSVVVLAFTVIGLVSICVVVGGEPITLPYTTGPFEIIENRLYIHGNHPNYTGSLFAISLMMAVQLTIRYKHWWGKVLSVLAALILYVALSLTASRTAMLIVAACLGVLASLAIMKHVKLSNVWVLRLVSVAAAVIILVVGYKGFSVSSELANWAATLVKPASTVETIVDAAEADNAIVQRDLLPNIANFNGRIPLYQAMLRYLPKHPSTLVIGNLDAGFMEEINADTMFGQYAHLHNAILQVLMATGLPGMALMLWFIIRLLWQALRLLFDAGAPMAERALALIPLVTLGHSMMEPFIFVHYSLLDLLFFLTSGVVIAHATHLRQQAKAKLAAQTDNKA